MKDKFMVLYKCYDYSNSYMIMIAITFLVLRIRKCC